VDTKDPPGRGKAGQVGRELAWEKLTRFEWSKSGAKRDRDANDDHSDLIRPNAGRPHEFNLGRNNSKVRHLRSLGLFWGYRGGASVERANSRLRHSRRTSCMRLAAYVVHRSSRASLPACRLAHRFGFKAPRGWGWLTKMLTR
jgi:hypothetical protein